MHLLIFIEQKTSRVEYAFKLIFDTIEKIPYKLTNNISEFETHPGPKINYSGEKTENSINIKPHAILFETDIKQHEVKCSSFKDLPVFFVTDITNDFIFDIFGASFFLVSRYEEYCSSAKDIHGRFKAENSVAFQNSFLEIPIINYWCILLIDLLKKQFQNFQQNKREYSFISTIDVDNAFAYRHKGFFRTTGAFLKSILTLNLPDFLHRAKVLCGKDSDPYDNFDYLQDLHNAYGLSPIYFFLVGNYGKYDKNISHNNKFLRKLIYEKSQKSEIGIHPSYSSYGNINLVKTEIERISSITGKLISKSRQHFLRMQLPETYKVLEKCGIENDYSMGYSTHSGFRAGTCTPFDFFDITSNSELRIKVFPFAVMDTTLKSELHNPEKAIEKIYHIVQSIKKCNGTFISLWHNESSSDTGQWKGWKNVLEKMLIFAK